jgi:F0F1-type ATP synthase membrane subunit a
MVSTLSILAAASGHGGFGLHEKLVVGSTALVVLVLIALAMAARGQIGVIPKGLGACFEHVFDWIDGMAYDMIGRGSRQYVPLLMSFFLFILFSNWSGLLPLPVLSLEPAHAPVVRQTGGLEGELQVDLQDEGPMGQEEHPAAEPQHVLFEAPTSSYNTTLALALISFFAFNWFGIKKNVFPHWGAEESHGAHAHEGDDHGHHSSGGFGGFVNWLLHYIQPTPMLWSSMDGVLKYALVPLLCILFLCLNIMEEFARILSLSLRLFGNIYGEHQLKVTLLDVMRSFLLSSLQGFQAGNLISGPFWVVVAGVIWGASIFATLLGTLAGFIQAMVFTMLSLVYIAHAVADEH